MAEILRLADSMPWRRAVREAAPDEAVRGRFAGSIGADFVYGMPWDEMETVLDVGSGVGFMTALLAERATTVVGLEPTPENALFQSKRAAQDGFSNWHPVIAGAGALPFAPETFDLIALNGAAGEDGKRLVERLFRLLKPDGYIYVGVGEGARRYRRTLKKAGFARVDVFGVFDGLKRQKAVYRLSDDGPRRVTCELVNPPVTWRGWALRRIAQAGPWRGIAEGPVASFGRKSAKEGRLAWSGLPHAGPVTQFSTGDKVFALCFDPAPSSVFKGPKSVEAAGLLAAEYAFLQSASRRHGEEAESWPLRWPKPLGVHRLHGREFYHYEFAYGSPLSKQLQPLSFDLAGYLRHLERLIERYVELCGRMTAASPEASSKDAWDRLLDRLSSVRIDGSGAGERIKAACEAARGRRWPTHVTHGDLSLTNAVVLPGGGMVLVDWERAAPGGLIAIDLVRLVHDAWDESALLAPGSRRAVMEGTRRIVRAALGRLGVESGNYAEVEALFVAHQFDMWLSRDRDAGTSPRALELLRKHRLREFALTS